MLDPDEEEEERDGEGDGLLVHGGKLTSPDGGAVRGHFTVAGFFRADCPSEFVLRGKTSTVQ